MDGLRILLCIDWYNRKRFYLKSFWVFVCICTNSVYPCTASGVRYRNIKYVFFPGKIVNFELNLVMNEGKNSR